MLSYASFYNFFRINLEKCYKNRAEHWTPWENFSVVKSKGIRKGFSNIVTPTIVTPNIVAPNIVTPYKFFWGFQNKGIHNGFWNQSSVTHKRVQTSINIKKKQMDPWTYINTSPGG